MARDELDEGAANEALQALLEGTPSGTSSLSQKIVVKHEGFSLTEANFAERMRYADVILRRHRNGGGWVPVDQDEHDPTKAYVDPDVYVGPHAMVLGPAKLLDGEFRGGMFLNGTFYGGTFRGGLFRDPNRIYWDTTKIYT